MNSVDYHPSTYSHLDNERLLSVSTFATLLGFHEGSLTSSELPAPHTARELIADKFNKSEHGATGCPTTQKSLDAEMGKYLFQDSADALGGSIIKVPAMELESPDNSDHIGAANIMPTIGSSLTKDANTNQHQPSNIDSPARPRMAASVLDIVSKAEASREVIANGSAQSRSHHTEQNDVMRGPNETSVGTLASTSAGKTTELEMLAAVNMGRPLSFTRSSAQHAPSALIRSLFNSFSFLVKSRVRTWTLLLLRHSLGSADKTSRNHLMSLLSTNHTFEMNAMITQFEVEDILPEIKSNAFQRGKDNIERRRNAQMQGSSGLAMEYCDLVVPLQFKASIDLTIQNHQMTVHLSAPATAGAIFVDKSPLIQYADISIDTNVLVSSMVEQARLVVFQSVSRKTSSTDDFAKELIPQQIHSLSLDPMKIMTHESSSSSRGLLRQLSQKSSTAPIAKDTASQQPTSNTNGHSLKRSGSSINRAGSFNQRPRTLAQIKSPSVQWDESVNDHTKHISGFHCGKRPTFSGASLTRSTKSFGKAHAEIFESSRNATFAEFGSIGLNPLLKKSGRNTSSPGSSAYHVSTHILRRKSDSGSIGVGSSRKRTDSFQLNRKRPSFPGSHEANQSFGNGGVMPSLAREKRSFHELSRSAVYSVTPPNASSSILGLHGMTSGKFKRTPTLLETMLLSSTQSRQETYSDNKEVWKENAMA